jgi:hypothetical protein
MKGEPIRHITPVYPTPETARELTAESDIIARMKGEPIRHITPIYPKHEIA